MRKLMLLALIVTPAGVPGSLHAQQDAQLLERARQILQRHPVIDGHNDLPWAIRNHAAAPMDVEAYDLRTRTPGHTDLERLRSGGVGGQFWSVYVPGEVADSGYARIQLEQFDIARRIIEKYPEFEIALSAADIERSIAAGRVASLIGMEGGHAIENSLGALRAFYDLGARYMTLTHNVTLDWADAATAIPQHGGLTEFGREVVHEMNRLGMLVDLSHVSPAVMSQALDISEAPVIFSHSSVRALTDVPRNVPDSILARLAPNGGVVMITFVPAFVNADVAEWSYVRRPQLEEQLRRQLESVSDSAERERRTTAFWNEHPRPRATLGDVADHIEHARRIAGIDHVGLGGDFDGIDDVVVGLEDTSTYPNLIAELLRRGWTEDEIARLTGGNILRVIRAAEATAARLREQRVPSTMTIPRGTAGGGSRP
jgi:membrane dipeptidase